ncbi:hypothetical protein [Asticcacaulis sp. EMRT-3]|uniref:hypothetical protein n=1 Tax=Asticcacaulis sp. EMRT-3 TaxID=3040349 RepID=UPI0024AFFB9C|nr:hypothetical protein [Asticcacaulis sp. EMRT-3]MDI7775799.1 hypothetical protein [Asticcacaulis sp. EMRT-3]
MPDLAESLLPAGILAKADFRFNEYAWRVADLPDVIAAAQEMGLLNLGGQLQIRTPEAIGECYWVATDPCAHVAEDLPWEVRVRMSAELSLRDLAEIQAEFDFAQEITEAFPEPVAAFIAAGGDLNAAIWFTWYVAEEEAS